LGPKAVKLYAKHYQEQIQGPIKKEGDAAVEDISRLIEQLALGIDLKHFFRQKARNFVEF
jgi:hypothetical protein